MVKFHVKHNSPRQDVYLRFKLVYKNKILKIFGRKKVAKEKTFWILICCCLAMCIEHILVRIFYLLFVLIFAFFYHHLQYSYTHHLIDISNINVRGSEVTKVGQPSKFSKIYKKNFGANL